MEKQYGQAIDVWSLGCILAEMLLAVSDNKEARPSFLNGTSCYPLSSIFDSNEKPHESQDQMVLILRLLGKQDDDSLAFVTDK